MSVKNEKQQNSTTEIDSDELQEQEQADACDKNVAALLQPGTTIKLEDKTGSYAYKMAMICPGNVVVCMNIDRTMVQDCGVGSIMNLVRSVDEGSCMIPVKVVGIGAQAELLAVEPIGKPQNIQRRVFARVQADSGVNIKLQIDNHSSRYKSLSVYDISAGGVGLTIYSKNPLAIGLFCRIEIQLPIIGQNNRLSVRGQIAHCSPQRIGGMEYLLGIKFNEISDSDQHKIIEYVAQRQKELDLAEEQGRQFAAIQAQQEEKAKKEKEENDPNRIVA